ncbi:MAG TPA: hypothetical protein VH186_16685 [Chloroflexia bacterium]|nr:hypothetical protein [Chloroflexia bacterium]
MSALTLERLALLSPLGLRFWDMGSNVQVDSGLLVSAWQVDRPDVVTEAGLNRAGIYYFPELPGLRQVGQLLQARREDPDEGNRPDFWERFWNELDQQVLPEYSIAVKDLSGRFLPFFFQTRLPVRNIFELDCLPSPVLSPPVLSPPGGSLQIVPLFSSPARRVAGGMAVMRGSLVDTGTGQPARYAWIEIRPEGMSSLYGFSDNNGQFLIIFDYPAPKDFGGDDMTAALPLYQHTWTVEIRAFYRRLDSPDICAMAGQNPATLWTEQAQTNPLSQVTLRYGQELVVRTRKDDSPTSAFLPVLLISPELSPP